MTQILPTRRKFLTQSAALLAATAFPARAVAGAAASQSVAQPANGSELRLPREFLFGAASAAYQIEGAWNEDGRGESIWDRWSHTGRGKVSGDVAADHYHRLEEDVRLLQQLGVDAYRFSIAWPRIFPNGRGEPNAKGVAFYRRLLDLLKQAGIKAAVTLYHWDLPQSLEDTGGWVSRETVDAFDAYARYIFREFGSDVSHWITFNEPWVTSFAGYWLGGMAPGRKDMNDALQATHHLLLAHGRAVRAHREMGVRGQIGITLDLFLGLPATDSVADQRAAEMINQSHHSWFADPIYLGEYPAMVCEAYVKHGYRLPEVRSGDIELIHQPIDFQGLNYYSSDVWKFDDKNGWGPYDVSKVPNEAELHKDWPWRPDGLYLLLKRIHERYNAPEILITENGLVADDFVNRRGEINDENRVQYIYEHLAAARRAMDEGVKLRGYFVWSFLDDYEWGNFGRLGLVHVDYRTLKRTMKLSGRWYAESIRRRMFALP